MKIKVIFVCLVFIAAQIFILKVFALDSNKEKREWVIEAGRVGSVIALDKPIPHTLLGSELEKKYFADYIADAQAIDAFKFENPPLIIVLKKGPFRTHALKSYGAPQSQKYASQAAKLARSGEKIEAIFVMGAGPKTKAGVGVGSSLLELQRAYRDFKIHSIPETWGNDTCTGSTSELPHVFFIFETCEKAEQGQPVLRVDLHNG